MSGSVTFPSVISGIYKVSISPPGANNPSNTLQNFSNETFFITVPETNGQTINVKDYILVNVNATSASFSGMTSNSSSFAYSIYDANNIFCLQVPGSASWAPFAITASFALSGGGGGGGETAVSASWASSSLSSILR